MTPACHGCDRPASWVSESGLRACEACREDAGEAEGWSLLLGGELDAYERARDLETHAALCVTGTVEAREVVTRVPHECRGCTGEIPARSLAVSVTSGASRSRWTAHYCVACVPGDVARSVVPMDAGRAWRIAREAFAAASSPEDVPAWVWRRFEPAPF